VPEPAPARPRFLELLAQARPGTPVALPLGPVDRPSRRDLDWLKQQAASGALNIVGSIIHIITLRQSAPTAQTYLLTPGVDIDAEIFDNGTADDRQRHYGPRRFSLSRMVSDAGLMDQAARTHLVALGAEVGWRLVPAPPRLDRAGASQRHEEAGLRIFFRACRGRKKPRPFRSLNEAPVASSPPEAVVVVLHRTKSNRSVGGPPWENETAELDRLRLPIRAAVEEWVVAIRKEEARRRSITRSPKSTMESRPFRRGRRAQQGLGLEVEYEDALRRKFFDF